MRRSRPTAASLEAVEHKVRAIKERIQEAGLTAWAGVRHGDALKALAELDGPFDLVLVDAWKDDYPAYFDLIFSKMRAGGLMVADNITFPAPVGKGIEKYVEKARTHPNAQSQLVPLGSGLELTVKLR